MVDKTNYSVEPIESSVGSSVCSHYTQKFCSCILYLRQIKGLDIKGNAIDLVPTHYKNPKQGDVIIFHYPNGVGHAAFIEAELPKVYYVSEWNYTEGHYTERVIQKDGPAIHGFIRPSYLIETS